MTWATYILITSAAKCYGFQLCEYDAEIENSFNVCSQYHV
jgi:hypothetical protein